MYSDHDFWGKPTELDLTDFIRFISVVGVITSIMAILCLSTGVFLVYEGYYWRARHLRVNQIHESHPDKISDPAYIEV